MARAARKVFTEGMIRRVMQDHFEIEHDNLPPDPQDHYCECGWWGVSFDDHFIDQLHKLWHEMIGNRPPSTSTTLSSNTISVPV